VRITVSRSIPDYFHDEIRTIVKAGFRGTKDSGVEVHVKAKRLGDHNLTGGAYEEVPCIAQVARTTRYLVTLSIPRDLEDIEYPRGWKYPGLKRAPEFHFCCWQADLFHLSSHEAAHVRQFRNDKPRSEVQAERWAARCMEKVLCFGCGDRPT
jgi:hypothetical protein